MLEVLVVIVVVSIASLKVIAMVEFTGTDEELSAGLVEKTIGLIPSTTMFLLPPKDAELSRAGSVKSARLTPKSSILPELSLRALVEL